MNNGSVQLGVILVVAAIVVMIIAISAALQLHAAAHSGLTARQVQR